MGRCASLILAFALVGCQAPRSAGEPALPHTVAIVARTRQHASVSVLVAVEPNERGTLDVRVAEGAVLPARDKVLAVRTETNAARVVSALDGRSTELRLAGTGWLFTGIEGSKVFFTRTGVGSSCELRTGECAASEVDRPAPALTHPGPGNGFRLALSDDGQLVFSLPHDGTGLGETILADVARIASVHWISDRLSADVQEYVDRTFRGRAAIVAQPLRVDLDGELGEWAGAEPAVVDAPWQLDHKEGWRGPDDASFSVAAAVSEGRLCFAGRLRDDVVTADDALLFNVGAHRRRVPLLETTESAVIAPEWFGHRFELCLDLPDALGPRQSVPLGVAYRDDDGDGTVAVLSTAPRLGPWSAGMLSLAP